MNLSVRAIRYFVATCELGSLSKAADAMHISNSAIAAAIDAVEQEFGVQLVLRQRSKGIVLTPAGRGILTHAKHLLDEYDRFLVTGNEANAKLRGTLKVGYFAPISPSFMPVITQPLIREGEDVYIEYISGNNEEVQEGLRNGHFDVAIFVDYAIHAEIEHELLMLVPPYLVTPKDHPLARKKSVRFSDVVDQDLILLNLPTTLEYYTSMLSKVDKQPKVVAGATNVEMVRSMVAAGLGCSILNMRPANSQTYFGSEVACVPISEQRDRTLGLVLGYMPGQKRKLTQAFIDNCRSFFAGDAAKKHRVVLETQ